MQHDQRGRFLWPGIAHAQTHARDLQHLAWLIRYLASSAARDRSGVHSQSAAPTRAMHSSAKMIAATLFTRLLARFAIRWPVRDHTIR
jgi:hypothetical protein